MVRGWPAPRASNLYVGDLVVGKVASGAEGPRGIAASMQRRITAFLSGRMRPARHKYELPSPPLLELGEDCVGCGGIFGGSGGCQCVLSR